MKNPLVAFILLIIFTTAIGIILYIITIVPMEKHMEEMNTRLYTADSTITELKKKIQEYEN